MQKQCRFGLNLLWHGQVACMPCAWTRVVRDSLNVPRKDGRFDGFGTTNLPF